MAIDGRDLYELKDIKELFGTNANIAYHLGIDPCQVSRWGKRIPPAKQIEIMRILDRDRKIKSELKFITSKRLHLESRESDSG